MSGAIDRSTKLILITELCRELAKRGLNVGLSDARPAVVVRAGSHSPLWITVDDPGELFEWNDAGDHHPVTDPAGAAVLISAFVKSQRATPGEAP